MSRDRFVKMTTLFPQLASDRCRVCDRCLNDARRTYCSAWCKGIAHAVVSLFSWGYLRKWVKSRDGHECVRCGDDKSLHVDHIVPVSEGGHPFDVDNLQTLCESCNLSKGTQTRDHRGETGGESYRSVQRDARQQLLSEVSDR